MSNNAFTRLFRKFAVKSNASKSAATKRRASRTLSFDTLEKREMFSVSSLWFSGKTLVVKTNNASTSVVVSQNGSNIRITEQGANRVWNYASSKVNRVEFQGGAGNDRFVNNVSNLPVTAFGNGGNDYLEGYNGADQLIGGAGNDTLIGYGGNDRMWGDDGDDVLRGGSGNDELVGGNGNDRLIGDDGNDLIWGGAGTDILEGGAGNDELAGGSGDDRLIGHAGNDKLWGEAGNDVLVSIDAAFADYVDGGTGVDTFWIDRVGSSRDRIGGSVSGDMVQEVASFTNGADRTLNGDRIADPVAKYDSGRKQTPTFRAFANNPLFSKSGPKMDDVRQGSLGDCYALAGFAAIARDNPQAIRHNIVDFGDGTYGVRLGNSFYRVDNDLPVFGSSSSPAYAKLGLDNSMWVAIMEKAYAHFRKSANSYASIEYGWSVEINRAFRTTSAGDKSIQSYSNATAFANDVASRVGTGQAVTIGFIGDSKGKKTAAGGAPLVLGHQYTVASVTKNASGKVISITLRNPWGHNSEFNGRTGVSGALVTLTPDQLYAQAGRVNWGRV